MDLIHHNSLHYAKRLVAITEEDYNGPTCRGAGSFQTWGIVGSKLALLDMFTTGLTRRTDFGFVCRLPSRRNASAALRPLPGIPLPTLPG